MKTLTRKKKPKMTKSGLKIKEHTKNDKKRSTPTPEAGWEDRLETFWDMAYPQWKGAQIGVLKQFIAQLLAQALQEQREEMVKEIKNAPIEFLEFHDMNFKDAVFVKQKDLLAVLNKLSKKGDK